MVRGEGQIHLLSFNNISWSMERFHILMHINKDFQFKMRSGVYIFNSSPSHIPNRNHSYFFLKKEPLTELKTKSSNRLSHLLSNL